MFYKMIDKIKDNVILNAVSREENPFEGIILCWYDDNHRTVYYKQSDGVKKWIMYNTDPDSNVYNMVYADNSLGDGSYEEYDINGHILYREDDNFRQKFFYDKKGREVMMRSNLGLGVVCATIYFDDFKICLGQDADGIRYIRIIDNGGSSLFERHLDDLSADIDNLLVKNIER